MHRVRAAFIALFIFAPCRAPAAERETVSFSVLQTTVIGQSVYVLGSAVELGANDPAFAVKLEPAAYPNGMKLTPFVIVGGFLSGVPGVYQVGEAFSTAFDCSWFVAIGA